MMCSKDDAVFHKNWSKENNGCFCVLLHSYQSTKQNTWCTVENAKSTIAWVSMQSIFAFVCQTMANLSLWLESCHAMQFANNVMSLKFKCALLLQVWNTVVVFQCSSKHECSFKALIHCEIFAKTLMNWLWPLLTNEKFVTTNLFSTFFRYEQKIINIFLKNSKWSSALKKYSYFDNWQTKYCLSLFHAQIASFIYQTSLTVMTIASFKIHKWTMLWGMFVFQTIQTNIVHYCHRSCENKKLSKLNDAQWWYFVIVNKIGNNWNACIITKSWLRNVSQLPHNGCWSHKLDYHVTLCVQSLHHLHQSFPLELLALQILWQVPPKQAEQ